MRSLLWVLPFCMFFLGYYSLHYWWPITSVVTPPIVGLPLNDACVLLSQVHLAPHILQETVDPEMPAGTVLRQIPEPGSLIKQHQVVELVIAQQSPNATAPDYRMMSQAGVQHDAQLKNIKYREYYVPSSYPQEVCIGQWPAPGMPLRDQRIVLYFSRSTHDPVIVPDLRSMTLPEVQQLCLRHGLPEPVLQITHYGSKPTNTILDQRPLAGSIMPLESISFSLLCRA